MKTWRATRGCGFQLSHQCIFEMTMLFDKNGKPRRSRKNALILVKRIGTKRVREREYSAL